ncbi:MAG: heavy metal resistance protein [Sphingomonas sp. 28-62-20]|uniref:periplasmic heavy metal sensor n=1 Tax=Sphingomonas sp. 28-62-20 TaxID=1970433 RepID=UPI000BD26529|nr:MAG: heavy metal resistance protein [Sphingomonas sp. 28-62-20]
MTAVRRAAIIGVIAFVAAIAGVFIGRVLLPAPSHTGAELHALLHDKLTLDAQQHAKLDALEATFSVRRKALELELRADNARLAEAIETEHGFGPRVAAAVDACHVTMGKLQKVTLEHVFAMRSLLRRDQTAVFDQAVVKALTADAQ